jgi:serine protease Do
VITQVEPNSEAAEKGLEAGDVIARAGARPVRLPSDLTQAIAEARNMGRDSVLLLVVDGTAQRFVALKLGAAQG